MPFAGLWNCGVGEFFEAIVFFYCSKPWAFHIPPFRSYGGSKYTWTHTNNKIPH